MKSFRFYPHCYRKICSSLFFPHWNYGTVRSMKKWVVSAVVFSFSVLFGGSFLLGVPSLLRQAKQGNQQNAEAACRSINPSFSHAIFPSFPQKAPSFSLRNEKGDKVSLADYRGQVVLLTFWATWCKTCTIEMPSLEKLNLRMQGKPFHLIAVSNDQDWNAIRSFFPQGTSMTILLDSPSLEVAHRYGTAKLPETYLIDKDGNIRYYIVSERQIWHLDQVIECLESLM